MPFLQKRFNQIALLFAAFKLAAFKPVGFYIHILIVIQSNE